MKHLLSSFVALMLLSFTCACHQDETDFFTQAAITLQAKDKDITALQAKATFTNLNTHQIITLDSIQDLRFHCELLRGAYQVNIEGTATYSFGPFSDESRFRATQSYVNLTSTNNHFTLDMLWLD